ncbi:ABC transporter permease [Rhodoligotrophos defluvii]|uniref:ABC transporter permease n=1 Tax=Rhodoligotrophos defluvii TaxID=2561934 RepID=UPI0010C9C07E|nr:ABC transporter permease [Rhodoligotrophos defluvii]
MTDASETLSAPAARPAPASTARSLSLRGSLPVSTSLLLLLPLAVLLGWAFFLPIAKLLFQSISVPTWTAEHYLRLLDEPLYVRIILRTIWIAVVATAITLLLGYPIALLMTRARGLLAIIVAVCVFVPLWTSVLVRSYAWIVLLQRRGIINDWLLRIGLVDSPLTLLYTEGAVLVAMSHVLLPFMILPIFSTLRNISPDLTKAALNLGASRSRTFLSVTLPLSLPGVFAGCLLVFVLALGTFITPALVGGPRTLMIATLISQQATEFLNWPFAGAVSFVLLVLSVGITVVFRRLLGIERMVTYD